MEVFMFILDEIRDIVSGKAEQKKCPVCGAPLKRVAHGYPTMEIEKMANKHPDLITLGGCMMFGDDRDAYYVCFGCRREFSESLEEIRLKSCPLEASAAIREEECGDYEALERNGRYKLLEERDLICNRICPLQMRKVRIRTKDGSVYEGDFLRTHTANVSVPVDHLILLDWTAGPHGEYIDVILTDIEEIEDAGIILTYKYMQEDIQD